MIRNNNGITLAALIITIIILLILAGVAINLSYQGMNEVKDNKLQTELGIVRQAITEQYTKAVSVGKIKIAVSEPQISFWVGEKITDKDAIQLPPNETIWHQKLQNYTYEYQEDCYYRLLPEDLSELGISDASDSYIVNYSTGEVYNETKKVNSKSEILYLPQTTYHDSEQLNKTEDTAQNFNDW